MLVLTLRINCFGSQQVVSEDRTMKMILFDGDCAGPYFSGTVLPGGVDTQTILPDGTLTSLSARYMLEGTTASGQPARLFVENNRCPGEKLTHPRIVTDSPELRWLEREELWGRIVTRDGQLTIELFNGKPE